MFKFARVHGMPDESDFVVYGAASMKTGAMSPTGDKISLGVLVKIEMNVQANALRITVRSVHPAATSAVMQTSKSLLV
jgi:hypothetical protein